MEEYGNIGGNIMSQQGVVRKVDKLGRIVVPKEFRRTLGIQEEDTIEMILDRNSVIISKHNEQCIFCGQGENLEEMLGKNVCSACYKKLSSEGKR